MSERKHCFFVISTEERNLYQFVYQCMKFLAPLEMTVLDNLYVIRDSDKNKTYIKCP